MRRLVTLTIVLMAVLLGTVAAAPGVSAQATDEHPAVGVWLTDASPDDTTDPLDLTTIAPGGIATIVLPDGTGYGPWTATGDRSADATFLGLVNDPEVGFLGFYIIRTSIEVAEDGQSFAGTYTFELPAVMAEAVGVPAGQLGPGDVTGQRIAVEPMGEPVGPLQAEGGPDESAPPEASPAG